MSNNGHTARDVLAENLAAIRARVGMSSAQELADKVKELGGKLDRAAISKIESKARNVSLDEALVLAAALDVAPVHLFVSLDTNVLMQIAPKLDAVPAPDARAWVRGRRPLPSTNEKTYRTAWIPESEWEARRQRQSRSVVYYVRLDDQRIKIGYSSRLRERVSSFRVHPSALLAFEPGGRDLERRRHEQFAAERAAPLEEFSASPRLMRWIDILREENGLPAWAKVPDTRVKVTRT